MRLDPEWRGKLPPGAQEQLDEMIASWRNSGAVTHVEVMNPGDCPAAEKLAGVLFPLSDPPRLPLAGCDRLPCCGCCYEAVLDTEGGADAKPTPTGKPASLSAMARLDSPLAQA